MSEQKTEAELARVIEMKRRNAPEGTSAAARSAIRQKRDRREPDARLREYTRIDRGHEA